MVTVLIIGLGLIGASIAKGFVGMPSKSTYTVTGYDSNEKSVDIAFRNKLISNDVSSDLKSLVQGADIIILAVPIGKYEEILKSIQKL